MSKPKFKVGQEVVLFHYKTLDKGEVILESNEHGMVRILVEVNGVGLRGEYHHEKYLFTKSEALEKFREWLGEEKEGA